MKGFKTQSEQVSKDLGIHFQSLSQDTIASFEALVQKEKEFKAILESNDVSIKQRFEALSAEVTNTASQLTQHDSVLASAA